MHTSEIEREIEQGGEIEREIEHGDECTRRQSSRAFGGNQKCNQRCNQRCKRMQSPACEEVEQFDETCSVCEPSSRATCSAPAPAPRVATRWWGERELRQI